MDIENVAERLLEERVRLGYNQSAFARLLGISRETLRLIEMGTSVFKVDILISAAAAGVDVQYVITGIRSVDIKRIEEKIGYEKNAIITDSKITGIGNISGNNVHVIHTTNHKTITKAETKPGADHISVEQRAGLKDLVDKIAALEKLVKKNPKEHKSIWAALNRHCKVNTYTLIPIDEFEKARKYLLMWLGRLNSSATAPVKAGDQWRKRYYGYIKVNTKSPDESENLKQYMSRNYGVDSLKDLDNNELKKVYEYVAGRKRRSR